MIKDSIITFLWSISPFGEAKVGIPYGILHDLNIFWVLFISILGKYIGVSYYDVFLRTHQSQSFTMARL